MAHRPFHHGNLRAVLLDHAETVLRERGLEALSLRELAREAGVSHGAPRAHFIDRKALVDALAVRGFTRLTAQVGAATGSGDRVSDLRTGGAAYLDFAARDAALLDLMWAAKTDDPPPEVQEAATGLFTLLKQLLGEEGDAGAGPPRLGLVLMATMQGTADLVTSRRLPLEQAHAVLDEAITLYVAGATEVSRMRTTARRAR
ncbi:TetR/AcrR family transcriptional regulator [Kineosporia sp. J2-2]|uniref:TetR/AcrR family transcriptional regulator n=1 Tax=Kineosporia corallincola TaxID=2835133 RepID=A0ABS5TRP1_9ACTN|nr:TetR/AcrR family transcriptional regulator [Kineosporia corallincola]MBT0773451.1 TetR/AcrR family transcriptional regulator [Kineosporia corallincola]